MSLIEIENKIKAQYNVVKSEKDMSLRLIDKIFCNLDNKIVKMLTFIRKKTDFETGLSKCSRHFDEIGQIQDMWIKIDGILKQIYKMLEPDVNFENKRSRLINDGRKVDVISKSVSQKLDQTISFPKPDPSFYKSSEWYTGTVDHILDRKNGKFIMIPHNPQLNHLISELQKLKKTYQRDPAVGEIFAVLTPDNLNCRAIRLPDFQTSDCNNKKLKILLIDTGEEILCEPNEFQFLYIPNELKKIPSAAIRCKANIENFDDIADMVFEFQVVKVEVANKKKGHFYDLYDLKLRYPEPADSEATEDTYDESFDSLEMVTDPKQMPFKICRENMTEQELEMLDEEPNGTTDPLVAVMGYHPKEDEELCKHYDPKIGGCFKKGHCRLKHMLPLKDGWSRDKQESGLSVPLELDIPREGAEFYLKITSIISVTSFYGHIVNTECSTPNFQISLSEMVCEMNDPEVIKNYKMFDINPAVMELVVVKYVDDKFYRGKVLEIQGDMCKVFYVDYGDVDNVNVKNLRVFNPKFALLPFQAVKFHLSNMQALNGFDKMKTNVLSEMCRNKILKARLVHADSTGHLFIRLFNEYGDDIGESLMKLGIIEKSNVNEKECWVDLNPSKNIPG